MLDLTETGVDAWFIPIRLPNPRNTWPPLLRPLERAPEVESLLESLGLTLSAIEGGAPHALPGVFAGETAQRDLQIVLSQLGAARLLRIIEWLANTVPNSERLILQLALVGTPEGQAISSSIRAQTARATITRMFTAGRVAQLQSCAEASTDPLEKT